MTDGRRAAPSIPSFWNPTRIFFGRGILRHLQEQPLERPVVLITSPGGTRRGLTEQIVKFVGEARTVVSDEVTSTPDPRHLLRHLERLPSDVATVVAAGGGSVLDSGKVLAALAKHRRRGTDTDGLQGLLHGGTVGRGESLPVVAIPTTAGTGSEVTPFATVWDATAGRKHSVAGPGLFPQVAFVDPELTLTVPESVTVSVGLDALSQGFEAYWNRNAGPVTDALALRAVLLAFHTLERLVCRLDDVSLRCRMMEASLLAGMAISGTRTALSHSISYPLTVRLGIPHGLACSFTLPEVLRFNSTAEPERLRRLAVSLGATSVEDLANRLRSLLRELKVGHRLRSYGLDPEGVSALGPEMITPGRSDNNLRDVVPEQATAIALRSWEGLQ